MTWYVASVIMSVRKIGIRQKNIPVYENFILVKGKTASEALSQAIELAEINARNNSDMFLNDKPAKMVFEGVRKLITISNPSGFDLESDPPSAGTELTYSEYIIKSKTQMKRLIQGKAVKLEYLE